MQVNESLFDRRIREIGQESRDHPCREVLLWQENAARLDAVGVILYQTDTEAKSNVKGQSEMIRSLDKLVKFVGIALIPTGIILFVQSFF